MVERMAKNRTVTGYSSFHSTGDLLITKQNMYSCNAEIWWTCYYVPLAAAAAAKSLQSCPTLCDPTDSSPLGSPVPGILQARILEWVAISFSSAWKWKWDWICSVVSDSSWPHGLQPTRIFHPWDFPGKSTGLACHCLLPVDVSLSKLREIGKDREG